MKKFFPLAFLMALCLNGCLQSEKPIFTTSDFRKIPGLDRVWVKDAERRELKILQLSSDGSYTVSDANSQHPKQQLGFVLLQGDTYLAQWCVKECNYFIALPTTDGWDFRDIEGTEIVKALAKKQGLSIATTYDKLPPETSKLALINFYKEMLSTNNLSKDSNRYVPGDQALGQILSDPNRAVAEADTAYERKDYSAALTGYRPLAEANNVRAQLRLGDMYWVGLGVQKDEPIAIAWYKCAAHDGNAEAQYLMGLFYYKGTGVPQDSAAAANWFR